MSTFRFISIFLLIKFTMGASIFENLNLKKSYVDYVERTAEINEDAILQVPALVRKYNYPCEEHTVKTVDGYVLELHRIPYGRHGISPNRPVAFLLHGILASSGDWVITGTKKGLAYILADEGYDVWMGNVRGNRYSRNHIYLNPDDAEFWDFSWHEMGIYDLPAMIDYVLQESQQKKLTYVGHSQANTIFYVMCSELPQYNYKIKAQFSLAPIAYVGNVKSPLLKFLSYFKGPLATLFNLIGLNEFLPQSDFMAKFAETFCSDDTVSQLLCTNALFVLCGFNAKQMNTTLLPVILGHTPAGSSTKQLIHYAQEMRSGEFRRWDYGYWTNYEKYGSIFPPQYNLKNVKVPVYLYYSPNDWLAVEKDVRRLHAELGNVKASVLIADLDFNHLDFMFAVDAKKLLYENVIASMKIY